MMMVLLKYLCGAIDSCLIGAGGYVVPGLGHEQYQSTFTHSHIGEYER